MKVRLTYQSEHELKNLHMVLSIYESINNAYDNTYVRVTVNVL